MSKRTKQLPNYLKRAETKVVLIIFNGVLGEVGAFTVTVSFCHSTYQVPEKLS